MVPDAAEPFIEICRVVMPKADYLCITEPTAIINTGVTISINKKNVILTRKRGDTTQIGLITS